MQLGLGYIFILVVDNYYIIIFLLDFWGPLCQDILPETMSHLLQNLVFIIETRRKVGIDGRGAFEAFQILRTGTAKIGKKIKLLLTICCKHPTVNFDGKVHLDLPTH